MKAAPPWVRSSRFATSVLMALAPVPTTPVVLAALLMSSASVAAVSVDVAVRRISLPAVAPSFLTSASPVVNRFDRVMSPL